MNQANITMGSMPIPKSIVIWLTGVSFVLFQFSLQLSSGVIIGSIMHEMQLSASTTGWLGSSFYFVYTGLQIPAGLLFDKKKSHVILSLSAVICSLGCFIFAQSHALPGLFLGRILIGTGSAFAFVGLSHLLRKHFPPQKFALMIGLSETLGFFATTAGIIGMGAFISHWGWRPIIYSAAAIGLMISFFCWKKIPDSPPNAPEHVSFKSQLISTLFTWKLWFNGIFAGLGFAVVTVFGALWAIPFIQVKFACNMTLASAISSSFFIGTAISCILFGVLPAHVKNRRLLIQGSCLATAFTLIILLYLPGQSIVTVTSLMFLSGLFCGGYLLAYTISNELATKESMSTATGLTNTLAVLSAPVLQPVIGYFLDLLNPSKHYTLGDYQIALLTIPIGLIIAFFICFFLPQGNEK